MRFLSFLSFSSSRGILELFVRHLSCTGIFSFISNEHSISSKVYTQFLQNCYFSNLVSSLDSKTRIGERGSVEKLFRVRDREVGRFHQKLLDGRCREREREVKSDGRKEERKKERKKEKSDGKKNKRSSYCFMHNNFCNCPNVCAYPIYSCTSLLLE